MATPAAEFEHALTNYQRFKSRADLAPARQAPDAPAELTASRHVSAYFGILRLTLGDQRTLSAERDVFLTTARDIEQTVRVAVAENSLNPQNIEAAIRSTCYQIAETSRLRSKIRIHVSAAGRVEVQAPRNALIRAPRVCIDYV